MEIKLGMDFLTDQGVFAVVGVLTLKCWSTAVRHGHRGGVVPAVLTGMKILSTGLV